MVFPLRGSDVAGGPRGSTMLVFGGLFFAGSEGGSYEGLFAGR